MTHPSWNDSYAAPEPPPWDTGEPDPMLVEMVESKVIVPGPTLDVGCGTGTNALFLAQHGVAVFDGVTPGQTTASSADTPKFIPDLSTITSSVTLAVDELIQWVGVTLNISHTYDGDLVLTLIAPDGTRLPLANHRGGSGDDYNNTVFYDPWGLETPISAGSPAQAGEGISREVARAINEGLGLEFRSEKRRKGNNRV